MTKVIKMHLYVSESKNLFCAFFISFLATSNTLAAEVFSCKNVTEARVYSDSVSSQSLYGDSNVYREMMAKRPTKVLIIDGKKSITFEGELYLHLKGAPNYLGSAFYHHDYWGLAEVYDVRDRSVTLWTTRSNGNNSQMSNRLKVNLYHCSR